MISVEQHLERILATVKVIPPFDLGVLDAQGCVLAVDVQARGSLPGFTNSAMDGYAVHARAVVGGVVVEHADHPVPAQGTDRGERLPGQAAGGDEQEVGHVRPRLGGGRRRRGIAGRR